MSYNKPGIQDASQVSKRLKILAPKKLRNISKVSN